MAFKFKCEHCGEELQVHYLKKGEEAQCTACERLTKVPESAEFCDAGKKPRPQTRLSLPIRQDEERRREIARELTLKEIANAPSVKCVKWVLDVVWYAVLVTFVLIIAFRLSGSAFFFWGPYIEVDARVRWVEPAGLGEGESLDNLRHPVIIGHNQTTIGVPWRGMTALVLVDSFLRMAMVLAVVYFLRRIFRAIRAGKPFTKTCAKDIRYVGLVIAVSGPIWGVFQVALAVHFSDLLCAHGDWVDFFVSLHPKTVFIGLVIIAIAHLFELAARIQREQDLTI
jgi:hypothetical protein